MIRCASPAHAVLHKAKKTVLYNILTQQAHAPLPLLAVLAMLSLLDFLFYLGWLSFLLFALLATIRDL